MENRVRQKHKRKHKYLLTMNLPVTVLAFLCCTVLISLLTLLIQPGSLSESLHYLLLKPSLLLLNYLPAVILMLVFYGVRGNVFGAAAAAGVIMQCLSYANLLKQEGRDDPLVPADIPLLRESLSSVKNFSLDLHPKILVMMAAVTVTLIVLAFLVDSRRLKLPVRIITAAVAAGCMVAAVFTVYADKDYYNALPEINTSDVQQVFNRYGFTYCFLHNARLYPVDKPDGFKMSEVEQWEQEKLESDEAPLDVNILFVMGEAFSDLSDEAEFGYTEATNPIAAYHRVCDSDQAISGHIVVSNIDAGTANTEFDVLTGMQTNMISSQTTSSFRTVHTAQETLARVLSGDGYQTWFLHPGESWFYNRSNVYDYFGISDQTFNTAFTDADYDGGYVTDQACLRVLEEGWEARTADGQPLFAYCTTIENHQAYVYYKYASTPDVPLADSLWLSDEACEHLSVYFYGAKHTAEMIEQLASWMDTLEEPTILVFFGDHRPNLGADQLSYREAGSEVGAQDTAEETFYTYQTPFVIRANTAFCSQYDFQAAAASLDLPEGNLIGSNYLGAVIYELTGHTGESAYWDFLTQARRTVPVISHGFYELPDGTGTDTLNAEQEAVVDKLHCWEYARLKKGLDLLED